MTTTDEPRTAERWKSEWADLYNEVVTSGLCTGCAACIVACPHDVLGYDTAAGVYKPFHLEEELGPGGCSHGLRGCTSCTRACPRFRNWETEADTFLFGRSRLPEEQSGIAQCRRSWPGPPTLNWCDCGQDGGVVSAILLWCARARPHRRRPRLGAGRGRVGLARGPRSGPHPGRDPGRRR